MRKLMYFRKDEIAVCESDEDNDETNGIFPKHHEHAIKNIEDADELVDRIGNKMVKVTNTIRGIDKRMCHNLKLIGQQNQTNIAPNIKKMTNFALKKF